MLRQLNSHQLAEMYAYYHVELVPVTDEERAIENAKTIQAMLGRASRMNEQRANQVQRKKS